MASESFHEISSRPMKLDRIVAEAQNFEFNPLIPLKYWLRTASTLLKEAKIYEYEGNEQQLYLLLFRHATLVLSHLSTHPDARQPNHRQAIIRANKDVHSSIAKLEVLKPRLNKRYESFEQHFRSTNASVSTATLAAHDDLHNGVDPEHRQWLPSSASVLSSDSETSVGTTNENAVLLAQNEIRRRASELVNISQPKPSKWDKPEKRPKHEVGKPENFFMQDGEATYHQHNRQSRHRNSSMHPISEGSKQVNAYFGGESKSAPFRYPEVHPQSAAESKAPDDEAPDLPPKSEGIPAHGKDLGESVGDIAPPTASSHNKNPVFTFKYSASLENGTLLRTVFLPPSLRTNFLSLALPNTRANLETCGILCGTLIANALFISKLVIPDQESTSDTCETINEDRIFDYVDGEDLMVLGWIHTHPTQSCFMSSRDLHTHAGYQAMMPESIAIVCAPSKEDWGVFRLTDPPGLGSILKCSQTGLFHPHAENNIYTDALRPGHVHEASGLEYDIVDLRVQR